LLKIHIKLISAGLELKSGKMAGNLLS